MGVYDNMTVKSKFSIKRFTHSHRYRLGLKLCLGTSSVLDYGTGSAYFLKELAEQNPDAELVGYEPMPEMLMEAREAVKDIRQIKIVESIQGLKEFDCVTCFEVLEHLMEEDQKKILKECKALTKGGGKLIISVPIESGVSSLVKNLSRFFLKQEHATNWFDVVKSFFRMRIDRRPIDGFIFPHTGFYFQDLEKLFANEGFEIKRRIGSPFRLLATFLNSQLFYVFIINKEKETKKPNQKS